MAMQAFATQPGRLNRFAGRLLKRAIAKECLGKSGRQIPMPKNNSDTYVARRYLPFGATSTDANTMNRFYQNGTGDRGNVVAQQHQMTEGVTPTPDSIQAVDVTVIVQQYGCLYGFTDKTFNLHEDDIPGEMVKIVGERVTWVNELIVYGALRACTNTYFGGGGTSIATVAGALTLGLIRRIVQNLQANHAEPVNSMLGTSQDFGTDAVSDGYTVYLHSNLEADIRDIPGFTPVERYATGKPMQGEIGKVERFRFITTPDLPSLQDAGAAIGATGCASTTGTLIDVYPVIVLAADAYGQIAVRGLSALDPTFFAPGQKEKSDPMGQRGYAGTSWWKAVLLENPGWMAICNVGTKTLL